MKKKLNLYIIFGIIFTIAFGTLLHFVYQWSGSNSIVGLFSPVNESVWEHLKLLFYPMSLWIIFGYFKFGKSNPNYISAALIGLLSGLILIPVLFYTYTSITLESILALDITIFVLSIIVAFFIMRYILKNYNLRFLTLKTGIFLWEVLFILFVLFTIFPPNLPIFKEF